MGIIESSKEIFKLAQQVGGIEIQQKVIDLQQDMLALQDEVQRLRTENVEFKDREAIDKELILKDNAYWRSTAPETRQGPFCKRCWDSDRKLITLDVSEDGYQSCPEPKCRGQFHTARSQAAFRSCADDSNRGAWPQNMI